MEDHSDRTPGISRLEGIEPAVDLKCRPKTESKENLKGGPMPIDKEREKYRYDRDPECPKTCLECKSKASSDPCFKCVDKILQTSVTKVEPEPPRDVALSEPIPPLSFYCDNDKKKKLASDFNHRLRDYDFSGAGFPLPSGKYLRYNLIPFDVLQEIVEVFTFGQMKHVDKGLGEGRSWKAGVEYSQRCNKILRHLTRFIGGETIDSESGRHHLAHLVVQAMMLLGMEMRPGYKKFDDRSELNGQVTVSTVSEEGFAGQKS